MNDDSPHPSLLQPRFFPPVSPRGSRHRKAGGGQARDDRRTRASSLRSARDAEAGRSREGRRSGGAGHRRRRPLAFKLYPGARAHMSSAARVCFIPRTVVCCTAETTLAVRDHDGVVVAQP